MAAALARVLSVKRWPKPALLAGAGKGKRALTHSSVTVTASMAACRLPVWPTMSAQ